MISGITIGPDRVWIWFGAGLLVTLGSLISIVSQVRALAGHPRAASRYWALAGMTAAFAAGVCCLWISIGWFTQHG